jgi:voltage-gated potassium channel Kch
MLFYFLAQVINSQEQIKGSRTFITIFGVTIPPLNSSLDIFALIMYFSMTTLAKIGYGDYFPISDNERLLTVLMLLISMIFFSFLIDRLIKALTLDGPKEEHYTGRIPAN